MRVTTIFLFAVSSLFGQKLTTTQIQQLSAARLPKAISDFREYLSIPNDCNEPSMLVRNMDWCHQAYVKRGFKVTPIETATVPLLLAEKKFKNAKHTVLFYTQVDGQPVDSSKWEQESPYAPVLKKQVGDGKWETIDWDQKTFDPEWRIYARSTSDSKGPSMMLMQALDILAEKKIDPAFNIKIIMDFQEEKGSPDLPEVVEKHKDLLTADFLVIMDGVRSVINEPTLTYGARGIATMTLKVFGPRTPAHSGQFGNYVPNPVFAAARLIAGMKDETGKVLIPGFYDGVSLSEEEKKILNKVPDDPDELGSTLGIARPESVGATYQEALQYPTLNIRGMQAAWVGKEVRTIIPADVVIEIDMRLVPETPGERQVSLVTKYIEAQGYHIVQDEPSNEERSQYDKLISISSRLGSEPFRTDYSSPMGKWLTRAVRLATGKDPIQMRTTGGSQPIGPFINALHVPAISVRIPNPGSNIHAPNENIQVGNFLEGIETCVGMMVEGF